MLPRCARRAQQQIRLHEVTRTQWRRLALELYKNNAYPAVISARSVHTVSQNVPLVTRRKCSSTTEYLLSYKACIERNDRAPPGCVQRRVQRVPTTSVGVRIHKVFPKQISKKPKLTDQDDVFGAPVLVLIPQLTDVKIRIIRRFEHISPVLLLALGRGAALKVRGRHVGFLQQRWA